MTQHTDNHKAAIVYYRSDSFGQVAVTVNFGSPVRDTGSIAEVNGIVARYQAYTHAAATLGDGLGFPDSDGQPQLMPEGYNRRKS